MSIMKFLILFLIKIYKRTSFFTDFIFKTLGTQAASCRFTPTCSDYFYQSVEKYGALQGSIMGFKRISKCHPWGGSGYDPVK